jgi:hypothetical protein
VAALDQPLEILAFSSKAANMANCVTPPLNYTIVRIDKSPDYPFVPVNRPGECKGVVSV